MANRRPSAKNSMKDLRQEFERVFGIAFLTLPLPEANVTNRSVCPTGLVSEQVATRRSFALILVPLLLVVTSSGPILRAEEVRCRPNIFGGLARLPRSQSAVIVHVSTQHLRGAGHHRAGRPRDNLPAQHLRRSGLSVGGLRVPLRPDDLRSPRG